MGQIPVSLNQQAVGSSRNALDLADYQIVSCETFKNLILPGFEVGKVKSASRLQETLDSSENVRQCQRDLVTRVGFLRVRAQAAPVRGPVRWIGRDDVKSVQ